MTNPPPMTDDLVGRLQQRMAAASEQPWVYRPIEYDDWGFIRGVQRDDRGIGPFRPVVAIAKDSAIREDEQSAHRDAGTDPYGPNALLIVDAVNSLPTLIARIEALEGALRPFALNLQDHVPDDQLIDTVAWTAGEHRAAKAALNESHPHAD